MVEPPVWKICSANWIGVEIKHIWNHHPDQIKELQPTSSCFWNTSKAQPWLWCSMYHHDISLLTKRRPCITYTPAVTVAWNSCRDTVFVVVRSWWEIWRRGRRSITRLQGKKRFEGKVKVVAWLVGCLVGCNVRREVDLRILLEKKNGKLENKLGSYPSLPGE